MLEMGAFEAKTHFSHLLQQVALGECILITRHGHPIAKLMPIRESIHQDASTAVDALLAFQKGRKLKPLDWKKLREEGRK